MKGIAVLMVVLSAASSSFGKPPCNSHADKHRRQSVAIPPAESPNSRRPVAADSPPGGTPIKPTEETADRPGDHGASSFQYFVEPGPGKRPVVCVGQVIYRKKGGKPACAFTTAGHCPAPAGNGKDEFEAKFFGRGIGSAPRHMRVRITKDAQKAPVPEDAALVTGDETACGEALSTGPVMPLCPKGTNAPAKSIGFSHRMRTKVTNTLNESITKEAKAVMKSDAIALFDTAPGYMLGDSGAPFLETDGEGKPKCVFGIFTASENTRADPAKQPSPRSQASLVLDWLHDALAKATGGGSGAPETPERKPEKPGPPDGKAPEGKTPEKSPDKKPDKVEPKGKP